MGRGMLEDFNRTFYMYIKDYFLESNSKDKFSEFDVFGMPQSCVLEELRGNNRGITLVDLRLEFSKSKKQLDKVSDKLFLIVNSICWFPLRDVRPILSEGEIRILLDDKDLIILSEVNSYDKPDYDDLKTAIRWLPLRLPELPKDRYLYIKESRNELTRKDHFLSWMYDYAGRYILETVIFEIDECTLKQMSSSTKIDVQVCEKWQVQGYLKKSEILRFAGFYNSLFDNEFMKNELQEQILQFENEKRREESTENVKKLAKTNNTQLSSDVSSSNCFVITATMGDSNHPVVNEFRIYRDKKLLTNEVGKAFVRFYYRVGPFVAPVIRKNVILRRIVFSIFVYPIYLLIKKN